MRCAPLVVAAVALGGCGGVEESQSPLASPAHEEDTSEVARRLAARVVATLDPQSLPPDVRFRSELEGPAVETDTAARALEEQVAQRSRDVFRSLRSLLMLEGVHTFDPLEIGAVGDGWTGPVILRLLDNRGRLAGSLFAERLRLEGSRSAHTLTLVLENGYESRGGMRIAFGGLSTTHALEGAAPAAEPTDEGTAESPFTVRNERRIVLPEVDPRPWLEALPELFGTSPIESRIDDGLHNIPLLRHSLNLLLREDAADGYFRVVAIGGVVGASFREVHVEEVDVDGARKRRIFADSMRLRAGERGIVLELFDGAVLRGTRKAPFLDGALRIYLPRARPGAWRAAGLPGLDPIAPGPDAAAPAAKYEPSSSDEEGGDAPPGP